MNDGPSEALMEALASLWRIPAPGPEDLRSTGAFKWLSKTALADYPSVHAGGETFSFDFALERALGVLGLPCLLPGRNAAHVTSVDAARLLDKAFRATRCRQRHLVPLDQADDLPELTFGPIRLRKFSATDLRELINATRLERVFPDLAFDAQRFSIFQWLVVEEELALDDPRPGARASPPFFVDLDHDFGQIEPHKPRFPAAVENALFALLLAPWEEWSFGRRPDWRGFNVPWVYTVVEDIFARTQPPFSADTLTWQPRIFYDAYGEPVEVELPLEPALPLNDAARQKLAAFDDDHWSAVERALSSPLFETPVAHFFVRAFLSEGIDEFLAHLTTIEAALGLQSDYCPKLRPKPDRHKRLEATARLRERIVALLEDSCAADLHKRLFDLRSCYLHGRPMKPISTKDRTEARMLARRVAEALVKRANEVSAPSSREQFLDCLLDRGAPSLPAS